MAATELEIPEGQFLCVGTELTMPEIPAFGMAQVGPLYDAADALKLAVLGPAVFFYHGADGSPTKRFHLEIGLPVREAAGTPDSPRYFKAMAKFKCLSTTHKGSMAGIVAAWSGIVHEALARGAKLNGEGREVYHIWESFDSAINVTELQIGI